MGPTPQLPRYMPSRNMQKFVGRTVIIAGKASNSLVNEFISRIGTETNLKHKEKIEIVIEVL